MLETTDSRANLPMQTERTNQQIEFCQQSATPLSLPAGDGGYGAAQLGYRRAPMEKKTHPASRLVSIARPRDAHTMTELNLGGHLGPRRAEFDSNCIWPFACKDLAAVGLPDDYLCMVSTRLSSKSLRARPPRESALCPPSAPASRGSRSP